MNIQRRGVTRRSWVKGSVLEEIEVKKKGIVFYVITLARLIYPRFFMRPTNPRKLSPSSGIDAALLL